MSKIIHKVAKKLPYFVITIVFFVVVQQFYIIESISRTLKNLVFGMGFLSWAGMMISIYYRNKNMDLLMKGSEMDTEAKE